MTLFQRIRRSFLALNLLIILMLSITFSFEAQPSFASFASVTDNSSGKEPDIAISKKGKLLGRSIKAQGEQKAEQMKEKTLEGIDQSIGKSSKKPDQHSEEVQESLREARSEARDAFK